MKRFILYFAVVCMTTSAFAQLNSSEGLKKASEEVWKEIQVIKETQLIKEKNSLRKKTQLLCIITGNPHVEMSHDSVLVGSLVSSGAYTKYYKNTNSVGTNVWVFIPKELKKGMENKLKHSTAYVDTLKRLHQFLGLDTIRTQLRDTFVFFKIKKQDLFRPAYNSSIESEVEANATECRTTDSKDPIIINWFLNQQKTNSYPWTRMGYTYDWGDNNEHFGATEFVTKKGVGINCRGYMTVSNFLQNYNDSSSVHQ